MTIDTGTGGFPIDGEVHTYDVGSDYGDKRPKDKWSPGDVDVDKTKKDLSAGTKLTLASYLSRTTRGLTPTSLSTTPNRFVIDDPIQQGLNSVDITKSGNFSSGNVSKFVADQVIDTSRSAAATSEKLGRFFRGKKESQISPYGGEYDGHTLLRDATDDISLARNINPSAVGGQLPQIKTTTLSGFNPINDYYGDPSPNLISNSMIYNRFNSTVKFESYVNASDNPNPKNERLVRPHFAVKYPMGKSLAPNDAASRTVSYGKLAQVGNTLSIRGGRELGSFDASKNVGNNPTDGNAQAAALLPGIGQLGVERTGRSLLEASSVLADGLPPDIKEDFLIDPMSLSWGTLNNVQDNFSGISAFGMQLLAAALLIALGVVFLAVTVLLGIFALAGGASSDVTKDELERRPLGANVADKYRIDYSNPLGAIGSAILSGQGFNFFRMIGIETSKNSFTECIYAGVMLFFGIKKPAKTAGAFTLGLVSEGTLSVIQSPGYYSVMARAISRSFLQIGDAFNRISLGAGVVNAIKQIFELIDVFRNSKFMRSLNVFIKLGDNYLTIASKDEQFQIDKKSKGPGTRFITQLDMLPNTPLRSRLNVPEGESTSALTMAWATYRAPDLFVMPLSLRNVMTPETAEKLGVPSMSPAVVSVDKDKNGAGLRNMVYHGVDTGRIPTEVRERMEDALESEYVPFYIHDVRTNEIVSFHAFLNSLDDSYTASYDSVDGFGRVEPIRTYKGTQRKIGFSFYIVAVNDKDFNSMWLKINKLTTMVYPQFTEGRILADGKNVMYAPFSQTIQAAPMVRVRIGDVIKSNYSKFNLARIFGFSYQGTKFDEIEYGKEGFQAVNNNQEEIKKKTFVVGNTFTTSLRLGKPWRPFSLPLPPSLSDSDPDPDPSLTLPDVFMLKLTKLDVDGTGRHAYEIVEIDPEDQGKSPLNPEDFKGSGGDDINIFGKTYLFSEGDVTATPKTRAKVEKETSSASTAKDYINKVIDFMDDNPTDKTKGNAVVRSFRSAGGKGLAGFIESLSFNWLDKTTWEHVTGGKEPAPGIGRRAPKMCLVTVSFSPVHDIAPGLDHVGANRAAIYPVGSHAYNDLRPSAGGEKPGNV